MRRIILACCLTCSLVGSRTLAGPPAVADPRLKLTPIAEHPVIVTPVAIDFGPDGKLYVIESHTHFPPKDYDGPKRDRIKVFDPAKPDAPPAIFHEGSDRTMGMAWSPDGWLYLVGRSHVIRVRDDDGDGKAEREESVLKLDTTQQYPHNALGGIAFSPDGKWLYLGCGENMGVQYTFVGSDGSGFKVTDGSGNIIRCTPDGKKVERIATGFWNPFGLAFHPNGELFATENDPDASPPCRLLHIVPGGDYGFRFQYGRSGRSPLLSWDGELPGTLGMVSGTGESPCEIVAFKGHLLVASWADHRIEMYTLKPEGGTYNATMKPLVTGGEDFRPVGLAISPDGRSLYISDWVHRDYTLHKKGRIWRVDGIDEAIEAIDVPAPPAFAPQADVGNMDTFAGARLAYMTARELHERGDRVQTRARIEHIWMLQLLRLLGGHEQGYIDSALLADNPDVRLFAVRWIADERLKEYRPQLDAVLNDEKVMTPQLFIVTLAAMEWLDTGRSTGGNGAAPPKALLEKLHAPNVPEPMRIMALRYLGPDHAAVTIDLLRGFIRDGGAALQLEAVRSLAARRNSDRGDPLSTIALDTKLPGIVRAEAIVGLIADAGTHGGTIKQLAADPDPLVKIEAERALRSAPPAFDRPAPNDMDGWVKLVEAGKGDPDAGRRIFFNPVLSQCSRCHAVDGRGGAVGPDLSTIGRRATAPFLLESILDPSREVAPYYRPWQLLMKDGSTQVGMLQATGGQGGVQPYLDAAGQRFDLKSDDIAERKLLDASLMPPYLIGMLSEQEVRDLIAYLLARR